MWRADGTLVVIDPAGNESCSYDVNDNDVVVGAKINGSGYQAFQWVEGQGLQYVGNLGGDRSYAYAINDDGQIVGWGYQGAYQYGFVLTPVPEPVSLSLLALGGLVVLKRKRKSA